MLASSYRLAPARARHSIARPTSGAPVLTIIDGGILDGARLRAYLTDAFDLVLAWCEGARCRGGATVDVAASEAARRMERAAADRFSRWVEPPSPLAVLGRELRLSARARMILLVVAAPRLWSELAEVYRTISGPGRPLVDESLVCRILGVEPAERGSIASELDGDAPLVQLGLVQIGDGARPFAELDVEPAVLVRLAGGG